MTKPIQNALFDACLALFDMTKDQLDHQDGRLTRAADALDKVHSMLTQDKSEDIAKALAKLLQPIETAPKDGTKLLLFCIGDSERYDAEKGVHVIDPTQSVWWASKGYWSAGGYWTNSLDRLLPPTHWLPLPTL
jgi:hypothetical protein